MTGVLKKGRQGHRGPGFGWSAALEEEETENVDDAFKSATGDKQARKLEGTPKQFPALKENV